MRTNLFMISYWKIRIEIDSIYDSKNCKILVRKHCEALYLELVFFSKKKIKNVVQEESIATYSLKNL